MTRDEEIRSSEEGSEEEQLARYLDAADHGGFLRFVAKYRVDDRIIEIDTIVASVRAWDACAESQHPEEWEPVRSSGIVYAQRVIS